MSLLLGAGFASRVNLLTSYSNLINPVNPVKILLRVLRVEIFLRALASLREV